MSFLGHSNDKDVDSLIGPMTDSFVHSFIRELKKKKNKELIMRNIIDPFLGDINNRYFPHMMTLIILLCMIVILLVILLIANTKNNIL